MARLPGGFILAELLQREFPLILQGNFDALSTPLRERVRLTERGCLEWFGARDESGYGLIRWNGTTGRITRAVWEIAHGVVLPTNRLVCHHCDNPPCFRVEHLFAGSNSDNIRDSQSKGRTPVAQPRQHVKSRPPSLPKYPLIEFLGMEWRR